MMAPPIDPGMHDKNSKLLKLLSLAKLATLRSSVEAPTSKTFSPTSFV